MSDRAIIPTAQWQEPDPKAAGGGVVGFLYPIEVGGVWGLTDVRPATAAFVESDGFVGIDDSVYPTMRVVEIAERVAMITVPAYVP